jgi:hypothetical protein
LLRPQDAAPPVGFLPLPLPERVRDGGVGVPLNEEQRE